MIMINSLYGFKSFMFFSQSSYVPGFYSGPGFLVYLKKYQELETADG